MHGMRLLAAILVAVSMDASIIEAAAAEKLADLVTKVRAARLAGDNATWLSEGRRMLALAPEHPDLLFSVARAEAANGNTDAALASLGDAVTRGGGFDLAAATEFKALVNLPAYKAIEAQNARNKTPVDRATQFAEIRDRGVLPEGIAYDAKRHRFLIGSMRGALWQVSMAGQASPFARPKPGELHEVLGVKVDAGRDLVWCVTGVFPDFPPGDKPKPDEGTTGVNAYDLNTAALRAQLKLDERPRMHGFNDLAVTREGDLYLTDSTDQSVHRLRAGAKAFEQVYHADDLTLPNGLVLSPDEAMLYVAHVEGVSAIDVKTMTARRLSIGADMTIGSIDGLAQKDGALIGVQHSPYLMRVIRMSLSGERVTKLEVLASYGLLSRGALTGVVVGNAFYVVATTEGPEPQPGAPPPPNPLILRVPL